MTSVAQTGGSGAPRYGRSLAGVLLLWAAAAAVESAVRALGPERLRSWPAGVAAILAAAVSFTIAWEYRRRLFDWITSSAFGAALLTLVLLWTVAGTLIIQNAPPALYADRYGKLLGTIFLRLRIDDIFHSGWLIALLALLALSLLLVAIRRRAWRPARWGMLLSHVGTCVVLAGGLVGNLAGGKGFLDLHEGRPSGEMALMRHGQRTGVTRALPFRIRLDRFEIDRYEPEFRLYVYERKREREEARFRVARSLDPERVREWTRVGSAGDRIRVTGIYPDFDFREDLVADAAGASPPGMSIRLDAPSGSRPLNLLATPEREVLWISNPTIAIRFHWTRPPPETFQEWITPRPARHVVTFQASADAAPEEVEVQPGDEVPLGSSGCVLRTLAYLPHFAYDTETREAYSRSEWPLNPALRVALVRPNPGEPEEPDPAEPEERWLFARFPDHASGHGQEGAESYPALAYRFESPYAVPERQIVFVGEPRLLLKAGADGVWAELPLALDTPVEIGPEATVTPLAVLASARAEHRLLSKSTQWRNPVLEVEHDPGDGSARKNFLALGHGRRLAMSDGRTFVAFEAKPNDVSEYRSLLSVLEGDRAVRDAVVEVNHPLSYGGYRFYQSNYREQDPHYSGILVVKDPGLPAVYTGFGLMLLGLAVHFYVRPAWVRLRERRKGTP